MKSAAPRNHTAAVMILPAVTTKLAGWVNSVLWQFLPHGLTARTLVTSQGPFLLFGASYPMDGPKVLASTRSTFISG